MSYFIGGALGSAVGGVVYSASGWTGVCALGIAIGVAAALTAAWDARQERRERRSIAALATAS